MACQSAGDVTISRNVASATAPAGKPPVATATYLFVDDVLRQSDHPAGYPDTWGSYTTISGTAKADYGMDPEMTGDATLRPHIVEGLQSLPVLSIVTDKDNLFSHEIDPDRGTNNRGGFPTGIFNQLIQNTWFARRYVRRAKEVLADDGLLGQQSVVEVWDPHQPLLQPQRAAGDTATS